MAAMIFKVPPHWGAMFHIDLEHSFTKALPGFRPSGRRSPFKTRSRRFCEEPGPAHGSRRHRGTSAWSPEGVLTLTGTFGMISGRVVVVLVLLVKFAALAEVLGIQATPP